MDYKVYNLEYNKINILLSNQNVENLNYISKIFYYQSINYINTLFFVKKTNKIFLLHLKQHSV